jgi:membrane protease YdiL (CAAX protease family)
MVKPRDILQALAWLAWLATAFFTAQFVLAWLPINVGSSDTLVLALLQALAYALTLGIGLGIPLLLHKTLKLPKIRELLGLARKINLRDLGKALRTIFWYYLVLFGVMWLLMLLWPDVMGQEQVVDFGRAGNAPWQLILIFLSVAVIAPVVEELLMRGLLFGRVRAVLPFWPTAVLISLLFGAIHLQLNVAIDTFILSMFMCMARERTEAVYTPIIMHVIKNSIGFFLLFMS